MTKSRALLAVRRSLAALSVVLAVVLVASAQQLTNTPTPVSGPQSPVVTTVSQQRFLPLNSPPLFSPSPVSVTYLAGLQDTIRLAKGTPLLASHPELSQITAFKPESEEDRKLFAYMAEKAPNFQNLEAFIKARDDAAPFVLADLRRKSRVVLDGVTAGSIDAAELQTHAKDLSRLAFYGGDVRKEVHDLVQVANASKKSMKAAQRMAEALKNNRAVDETLAQAPDDDFVYPMGTALYNDNFARSHARLGSSHSVETLLLEMINGAKNSFAFAGSESAVVKQFPSLEKAIQDARKRGIRVIFRDSTSDLPSKVKDTRYFSPAGGIMEATFNEAIGDFIGKAVYDYKESVDAIIKAADSHVDMSVVELGNFSLSPELLDLLKKHNVEVRKLPTPQPPADKLVHEKIMLFNVDGRMSFDKWMQTPGESHQTPNAGPFDRHMAAYDDVIPMFMSKGPAIGDHFIVTPQKSDGQSTPSQP